MTDAADTCACCHRTIPTWDLPRYACQGCQQRTSGRLAELPTLYAALDATPTKRTGSAMVGGRHRIAGSRVLVDLAVVDLTSPASRDSVLMKLATWAEDWAAARELDDRPARWDRDDDGAPREPVTELCGWLRWRLDWAVRNHPAIDDFVDEVDRCFGKVHASATGDHGERPVWLLCPCGGTVAFRASGDQFRCGTCRTWYGRTEVTSLPLAERNAAA